MKFNNCVIYRRVYVFYLLKKLFLWDCLIFVQYKHYRILGGSRHDTLRYFPAATYMMNIHRFRAVSYLLFATPTRITCVCQMQISLFMESAPQHVHRALRQNTCRQNKNVLSLSCDLELVEVWAASVMF